MFSLIMKAIPWKATTPEVSGTEGTFMIIADAQSPNITNLLPVGSQFYFVPASTPPGTSEDSTITRTCTSVFFDGNSGNNENIFTFTPAPTIQWGGLYWVVILANATQISTLSVQSATATPSASTLLQVVSLLTPS